MATQLSGKPVSAPTRRMELVAFLFLTMVLVPVLAVGVVGSYGLAVWIYQIYAGPPTGQGGHH